ncbi:Golgi-associated kinase 1B [Antennarius striatus]|uniref:Golgi-associated kinase 1B n=1 Tax=Antennarius striatus TaxID=241820 RepID=UPI0035B1DB12
MAWRLWSKLFCGQKWLLLLSPVLLLFITIFLMTVTLPPPLPPAEVDRRSSRALSSAVKFRSRPRVVELSLDISFQQPPARIHHRTSSAWKETSKHSALAKPAGANKNSIRESRHAGLHRNKHKGKGIASTREETVDAIRHPTSHHSLSLPEFTDDIAAPRHRIKTSNHNAAAKHTVQTYIHPERNKSTAAYIPAPAGLESRVPERGGSWKDRHRNRKANINFRGVRLNEGASPPEQHQTAGKHRQFPVNSDRIAKEQRAVKVFFRDLRKHYNLSQDPPEAKKNPGSLDDRKALSKPEAAIKKHNSGWCVSLTEQDFPESDLRRVRITPRHHRLPWLSDDDIHKMLLLAEGEVVSKNKVPAHGQVLQVALDPPARQPSLLKDSFQHEPGHRHPETLGERCQRGLCSLVKRTDDWFEVFAFHLDRVLGLNRSLPAVLRTFHSTVLPYRYLSGTPRPIVWWDPDIQHLTDRDNDQNSVPLSWLQYQELLGAHCGSEADLRSAPCVGIHHSEWGRLALFDFLLQLNDRLDRYCCGFTPDPAELCVENLLHTKCGNTKDLLLVHILVKKADPSRLVFIDNAGRPHQSIDNLNFRLLDGIDQFPETAVSVLQSGCLESLLLRSLYTDKEFWDSQGGASGLRPLIHTVESRGKILLQHIRDRKLQLKKDL